jgi:hypothetical protein
LPADVGLERLAVDLRQHRLHGEEREEEREAHQHAVRRRLLHADRHAQHRQHHDDAGERGHHHQRRRRERQRGEHRQDLERGGDLLGLRLGRVDADVEAGYAERLRQGERTLRQQQEIATSALMIEDEASGDARGRRSAPGRFFRRRSRRGRASAAA